MDKDKKYSPKEKELEIMNDPAIEYLAEPEAFPQFKKNDSNPPCQYSVEELRKDAELFLEELERNDVSFLTHDEMKKKYN